MCWEELRIPDYINAWLEANGTEAGCDTLGFAQCFLGAHGFTGLTCDDITSNTCPPFDTIRPDQYSSPQEFYVLWNIYNVYQLFNSWSLSLYNGAQLAAGTLDDIVATISPPTNKEVVHGIIYSLIAGSFYFLGNFMAIGGVAAPLALVERLVAGLLVSNVAVAFSMTGTQVNALAHGGDTDFRFTTLGTIGTDLSNLVVEFQRSLASDIKMMQGNHTMFLALANEGALSLRLKSGLVDQSVNLFRDLQVYIISEALAANGAIATKSTGVNALTFAPETPGTVDCPSLGPAGNCFQYWVDEESNNTYSFHNPGDWNKQYVDIMNKIYDEGWANISDLVKIEDCQGKAPEFNPSTFNMTCLATHKLCEWNYPPDEHDPNESYTYELAKGSQYTNCDNDGHWGYACSSFTSGLQIPSPYIGPALMYPQDANVWCPYLE